ncbi:MAG: ATP-binding protein, partial [Bacteroidota bacterium]
YNESIKINEESLFKSKTELMLKIEKLAIKLIRKNGDKNLPKFSFKNEVEGNKKQIIELQNLFELTLYETAIFCIAVFFEIENDCFSISELKYKTSYQSLDFHSIRKLTRTLERKGWLKRKGRSGYSRRNTINEDQNYTIPTDIINSLLENEKPKVKKNEFDVFGLCDMLYKTLFSYSENDIDTDELNQALNDYESEYSESSPFNLALSLDLGENEKTLFYYLVSKTYIDEPIIEIERMLYNIFKDPYNKIQIKMTLQNKKGSLFDKNIIEFVNEDFQTDKKIKLGEETVKKIFGENSCFMKQDQKFSSGICRLIDHQEIIDKDLFYNDEESESINTLSGFLDEQKFNQIIERLKENKMRTGLTVLFYGYPGTGKTESIYQLAKKSGRNIIMVNISEIRDKWVGESEKRLKSVFETYKNSLKRFKKTPILLFNESDALIGRRINVNSSVDQMNNSMQNILLQEMEDFNGIMMATTNLTGNLDQAFERRFLYKIKFNKPNPEAKKLIWKNKLNSINEFEAETLSQEFDFSGGQIENISRKIFLDNILTGKNITIDEVIKICREEILNDNKNGKRIGF